MLNKHSCSYWEEDIWLRNSSKTDNINFNKGALSELSCQFTATGRDLRGLYRTATVQRLHAHCPLLLPAQPSTSTVTCGQQEANSWVGEDPSRDHFLSPFKFLWPSNIPQLFSGTLSSLSDAFHCTLNFPGWGRCWQPIWGRRRPPLELVRGWERQAKVTNAQW